MFACLSDLHNKLEAEKYEITPGRYFVPNAVQVDDILYII